MLDETASYLLGLGDETSIPDSYFAEDELLISEEADESVNDAASNDSESSEGERKRIPKPKVTLPKDCPGAEYEEQTVLINPVEGVGLAEIADVMGVDMSAIEDAGMGYYSVNLPNDTNAETALEALQETPGVATAQPDFVYHLLDDGTQSDTPSTVDSVEANKETPDDNHTSGESSPQEGASDENDAASKEPIEDLPAAEAEEGGDVISGMEGAESFKQDSEVVPQAEGEIIENAGQDENLQALATTNDPKISDQWALASINAFDAWDVLLNTEHTHRVTVAVIDTGFNLTHEDLVENLMFDVSGDVIGYNAVDGSNDVSEVNTSAGVYGHGTHVTGIISAAANNSKGVAGVSYNQKIYPVKAFKNDGSALTSTLLASYKHVLQHKNIYGIRVVNMSVGTKVRDAALNNAIETAYSAGVVTVAASGNSNKDADPPQVPPFAMYPCDFEHVVGVINIKESTTSADGVELSSTSNYNIDGTQNKNICAPGSLILSTYPIGKYSTMSGTSMAAPFVSGVLAMMFSANYKLSAEQAISILYDTARDLKEPGFDDQTGWGEVDAKGAMDAAVATQGTIEEFEDMIEDDPNVFSHIDSGEVSNIAPQYFTGSLVTPKVTVHSITDKTLTEGVDYEITYCDNDRIGLATATITGIGLYSGEVTRSFEIIGKPVYSFGATSMPIGSTSEWSVKNCTLKVTSGTNVVGIAKDGKTVKAKAKGSATIAIQDNAGRTVTTKKIEVYKLSGAYFLQSAKNKTLNMSVKKASKKKNARAVMYKKKDTKSQKVKFTLQSGYYRVKYVHSGKCLTVKGASKKQKADAVQAKASTSKAMQWKISVDKKNRLTFTNRNSGKVLAINGSAKSGAGLVQRKPTGALVEKWVAVK